MQRSMLTDVTVLPEVDENGVMEKETTNPPMINQWRRQYMRGISTTPSQGGVYYEALKGSCNSLVKGSRNYRPGSMRKVRRRAVFKNGDCNVLQKNLTRRRLRFLQDMYTTLVDSQWRWTLLVFALSFILSWLIFAVLWWLIMYTHGDLEEMHLPDNQEESGWQPCVSAIEGFTSCFLFSIETQHTIGYGVRTTSPECPEAIFMMCFQSIYGVMSSAFMAGIVFAKMTRAKQRAQTLLFSKNAVICQRDGFLTLMFRVGDMRKSHIIGAAVRAQLVRTRTTKEGEVMTQYFTELEIGSDESGSSLFFIWPMVIEHKIDENSPLYNMSATDLLQDKFEIVVILEGTVESTGQSTQARSSYINTEILWGHRFDPVVVYNKNLQAYEIDYARFNETTQVDTPLCSARELHEIYKVQEGFRTPDYCTSTSNLQLHHPPIPLIHVSTPADLTPSSSGTSGTSFIGPPLGLCGGHIQYNSSEIYQRTNYDLNL
ncbi:G protein-activated inward rectifier potassium channel 3-like isoform X2 [Teleopsis dalmanni]|uniref:G protein-activated inward rectifier potassium channel 3-like isoform X2 n=1 Tax=Teleopsis dalmanni TaxID=139649 RepID=UPI0018CFB5E6|nr:G protein-activated inward rectifier potassium channel 3-like isoform X2 [Teleopsis dalmanni]